MKVSNEFAAEVGRRSNLLDTLPDVLDTVLDVLVDPEFNPNLERVWWNVEYRRTGSEGAWRLLFPDDKHLALDEAREAAMERSNWWDTQVVRFTLLREVL
jgi:hypothetical protein